MENDVKTQAAKVRPELRIWETRLIKGQAACPASPPGQRMDARAAPTPDVSLSRVLEELKALRQAMAQLAPAASASAQREGAQEEAALERTKGLAQQRSRAPRPAAPPPEAWGEAFDALLVVHRSAAAVGRLVGVSDKTASDWRRRRKRPNPERRAQLVALAAALSGEQAADRAERKVA